MVLSRGSGRLDFRPRHGATLVNEGVVTHVRGGESPARQIRDPVTELIMTRRDEAIPLAVEGVTNIKFGVAAVTVFGEDWGLKAIAQEGGITPFLRSQLGPVDCQRLHRQPSPGFFARLSRRVTTAGALAMFVSSDATALAAFWRLTAALPSRRQAAWYAVWNGTWPLSADTRCPVMTQDA